MEIRKESKEEKHSNATLEDRKRLVITGVIEVVRFNEEQINLNTSLGAVVIRGENLKMNKLDVQNGDVMVTGLINSIVYSGGKKDNESIIAKLFK
ncbi:MAG: sporulation protein YabP [Clostridiaceae bacterium]